MRSDYIRVSTPEGRAQWELSWKGGYHERLYPNVIPKVKLVLKKSRSKFWLCDSTGSSSPLERLSYYGANVEKIGDKVKHTDLAGYPSYLEAHPIMPLA